MDVPEVTDLLEDHPHPAVQVTAGEPGAELDLQATRLERAELGGHLGYRALHERRLAVPRGDHHIRPRGVGGVLEPIHHLLVTSHVRLVLRVHRLRGVRHQLRRPRLQTRQRDNPLIRHIHLGVHLPGAQRHTILKDADSAINNHQDAGWHPTDRTIA